jgi:hypothetical protein
MKVFIKGLKTLPIMPVDRCGGLAGPIGRFYRNPAKTHVFTDSCSEPNLGIMSRDGEQQYPTAVSLILVDARGESQLFELKSPLQVSDAGRETLYLPLPVGATFSVPVDVDDYWAPTSKDYTLKPGTYSLAAQFNRMPFPKKVFRVQSVGQRAFDIVNPEAGPSTSNLLQIDVPSR